MGNLAEQIGKTLNPDNKDLSPRMAARLTHEDMVERSVAKTITPAAKYAKKYNASEDDVTAGHAS
eukprot:6104861-Pyramimonas_sp.AAC.1